MKLLTHNMLTSHVKGVTQGYPLLIKATEVKVNEVDFNPQFVSRMIPKLEWSALVQAAEELGQKQDLPDQVVADYENDEEFLKKVHRVLLEYVVENLEENLQYHVRHTAGMSYGHPKYKIQLKTDRDVRTDLDSCQVVEVMEGCLKCPESGREFPISRGIPNMLLNEDEA